MGNRRRKLPLWIAITPWGMMLLLLEALFEVLDAVFRIVVFYGGRYAGRGLRFLHRVIIGPKDRTRVRR